MKTLRLFARNERQRKLDGAKDLVGLDQAITNLLSDGEQPRSASKGPPTMTSTDSSSQPTTTPPTIPPALSAPREPEPRLVQEAPCLDLRKMENLDWKLYRQGHRAGWIFAGKAPKILTEELDKKTQITAGEFTYRYSGPADRPKLFVSRTPVKE